MLGHEVNILKMDKEKKLSIYITFCLFILYFRVTKGSSKCEEVLLYRIPVNKYGKNENNRRSLFNKIDMAVVINEG